jgi:D-3-phosphoglycerate dehydrogenase
VRIGILEPDGFSVVARARLEKLGDVIVFEGGGLSAFLQDKQVLFVRLRTRIDGDFLALARKLRVLCSPTTGLTHIDLEALAARRVQLLSLKGEAKFLERIRATPEHAVGLLIALLRNYRIAFQCGAEEHWDRDRCRGEELFGMQVGIAGFGRVGRRIAHYLCGFEAEVGWFDPYVSEDYSGTTRYNSLTELISSSRAVVLAASYELGSRPLIDAELVAALAGKYFVNVARGELVDDAALRVAVKSGQLAGCAVDVISDEYNVDARRRWREVAQAGNTIVTPHIAGATYNSMRATEEFLVQKLADHLARLESLQEGLS